MLRLIHNDLVLAAVAGALCLPALASFADPAAEIQTEAAFASGLVDWRFPDYAQKVVDKALAKHGETAKAEMSRVRVKIMTAKGDFTAALALVNGMPSNSVETMSMKLTLADQFYLWGKLKEAREIYDAFFNQYPKGPPPELQRFYGESAYKYAQMLDRIGAGTNAIQAFRYILLTNLEEDLGYQIKTEMSELIVRVAGKQKDGPERTAMLDEALKFAMEVQWSGWEKIWFWRSVVVIAHIRMIQGKNDEARKIITANLQSLEDADKMLRDNKESMKLSPMAECRYLMGVLCEEKGRELVEKNSPDGKVQLKEALTYYCTLIIRYPASQWTMDARKRVDGIVTLAKSKGWPPPKLPKFDNSQFVSEQLREARLMAQNGDFTAAADKYREVLAMLPEKTGTPAALGELAKCYIESEPKEFPYYSKAVSGYVGDRFCKNTNLFEEAGDVLLSLAGAYESRGDRAAQEEVYDLYFAKYAAHKKASDALFRMADIALRRTNYVGALKYYQLITERYPNSRRYVDALSRTADCYARVGDHTNAISALTNYLGRIPAGIEQLIGRRKLADEYLVTGQSVLALNEYIRLVAAARDEKIGETVEDKIRKKEILEWAMYQKAAGYARIRTPPEKVPTYQTNAIVAYREFMKEFPKSEDKIQRAMGATASLLTILDKQQEANDMFEALQSQFPNSEYSQNMAYVKIENLLSLGRTQDAVRATSAMFNKPDAYKPDQFYRIGTLVLEAEMYEDAVQAFTFARATTNGPAWQLASIGIGRALVGLRRYEDAVKPIEEVFVKFPRSPYTVEGNRILGRCYAEIGKKETNPEKRTELFNKAINAMNRAGKFVKDAETRVQMELEIATIQMLKGNKNAAAAAYQRILMFVDPTDVKLRTHIESAFEAGTPLLLELQLYQDVIDNCDYYLKHFQTGRAVGRARDWRSRAQANLGTQPQR